MPVTPAELMPFCGEVSCQSEYRRLSQTGHKDTKGESAFKWHHSCPRCRRVLVGGVCEGPRKVENKTRRERVGFYFNSRSQIGAVVTPYLKLPGAERSRFEWKTTILRTNCASQ